MEGIIDPQKMKIAGGSCKAKTEHIQIVITIGTINKDQTKICKLTVFSVLMLEHNFHGYFFLVLLFNTEKT